jgi:hypothetical protein
MNKRNLQKRNRIINGREKSQKFEQYPNEGT